jgi:ribulose 1,5-bisphosphate synthetase/thiazole synthase
MSKYIIIKTLLLLSIFNYSHSAKVLIVGGGVSGVSAANYL